MPVLQRVIQSVRPYGVDCNAINPPEVSNFNCLAFFSSPLNLRKNAKEMCWDPMQRCAVLLGDSIYN